MQSMILGVLLLVYGSAGLCVKLAPSLTQSITVRLLHPVRYATSAILRALEDTTQSMEKYQEYERHPIYCFWVDLIILPALGTCLAIQWSADMANSMFFEMRRPLQYKIPAVSPAKHRFN